ncbi:cupredoxin domain-containing protein [Candidatus Daviesbacteria bacterium]|nr:cupredoxin domain-containing protein [Candidatus Daviesbacteria bacterium]
MGGLDFGLGETVIDAGKLSMRRQMDPEALDGRYTVFYNACWPDGSCHDGSFQFAIDRSLSAGFTDLTNQKEIEIKMSEIMFKPKNIKVSKGTKITWVNDDSTLHYVNTDSHPAHTYYIEQNSKALKKGDSYSLTLNIAGIYPYHSIILTVALVHLLAVMFPHIPTSDVGS